MTRIFLLLATSVSLLFGAVFSALPLDAACFWSWTGDCGNPGQIQIGCPNGECTIDNGAIAASDAVGDLLTKRSITEFVQDVVRYALGFVSIVAVVYIIYAGFQLMISAGDEEKAKKTRKIITFVIVGILVMWLAYWIVDIIIGALKA